MELDIPKLYKADSQLLIRRAYQHARMRHEGVQRLSGEPYIVHPVAVAEILMSMPARPRVVAAGLLHDILEDTGEDFGQMREMFGFQIARIVNSVSKTKKIERISKRHAESKRKVLHHLFLDTIKDIRAAVIKVADRLHNMRTIEFQPHAKQVEIADETVRMFVPLARQIGLREIERELDAICKGILSEEEYAEASAESHKYEAEIEAKGYHQNKLDLCLLRD